MAYNSNLVTNGDHVAGEDLSTYQYCFVKLAAGGWVHATAGDLAEGVLMNKPASGQAATVATGGSCKLKVAAALAKSARVTPNAGGQGVAATLTTDNVCAILAEASTGANSIVSALIMPIGTTIVD